MSLQKVLEDWSDYERRKSGNRSEIQEFNCTEPWEVNYLIDKIKKVFPWQAGIDIHKAILQHCMEDPIPHPRRLFVKAVLNSLGLFV